MSRKHGVVDPITILVGGANNRSHCRGMIIILERQMAESAQGRGWRVANAHPHMPLHTRINYGI